MLEITSKILKTDVTCVKCFGNYILAGIGNNLHVFSIKGCLLQVYPIFHGQKIHGIIPNTTNKIAVFGGNHLKIIEFDFLNARIIKDLKVRYCKDWIFALQWLDSDTQLATIFANNFVSLWFEAEIKHLKSIGCIERCTLYSASLVNTSWSNLFVLSGTVFGQILIWKPAENVIFAPVLHRLEGHDGAIFSIAYSQSLNTIVTTSDDRTVRLWSVNGNFFTDEKHSSNITLKHTMYGHVARVFRCKIIKNCIVTAGEDSFVHIWNFNGELIRKFETHQGGCVWALDYCNQDDLIITGGGDSGISLYPLKMTKEIETLPAIKNEIPRSLRLTAANNIVVIMDSGRLKYFKIEEKLWIDIRLHEDLKSYAVLEISNNRELIALAGFRGTIHIYKEQSNSLIKLCSLENTNSNRIFSLHWLNINKFLTSTVDGLMNIWCLKQNESKYEINMNQNFILPLCKERWATSAVFCFKNNLAVGDRKGNIHLYELNNENCVQSLKKAHCHLGVTSLNYSNNYLYSLGRNGILNKYSLNSWNQLFQVTNDKLPFSWLASMIKQNGVNLLLGFWGTNFIVYNLDQRRIILELNCGGGHRSWDVMVTERNVLYFYFMKEKRLNKFSEKWANILSRDIVNGFHTKEINCGAVIKLTKNNLLFISGGEDTTLRLSIFDLKSECPKFSTVHALKSHLSSVRCISVCSLEDNNYLIFSGGGRAQIIMQKLQINYVQNNFQSINCHQLDSYYKQLNDDEAETRIMDLVTINLEQNILLIAGSSDGTLKCYSVNLQENLKLKFVSEISYAAKCIIRLSYIKICDRHVVISMATDGKLVFWDFSEFCDKFEGNLKPFYSLKANQSGVNSFYVKSLRNETYLFATGGDDNSVVLNVVNFVVIDSSIVPNFICKWNNSETHGAQVTGIFIHSDYFITTSIDQHISVFKYVFENNDMQCELLTQYCSAVSDVQGMNCAVFQNEICTCIYGKGIEIFNLHLL